jgi:ABC-type transport system involved in multi-copper enzyme maturation permease subunit
VIAQLRSELLKQRSTRSSLALLAWMVTLVVLVVALHVLSFDAPELARPGNQTKILGLGTAIGALFAALFGALSITAEFRTGTIRSTLLVTPRRTCVAVAKAGAAGLAGAGVGVLAEALTAGAEAAGLAARGIPIELGAGDYAQLVAGGAAAGACFGVIGFGVGATVRNQVAAVAGLCVWLLFVEPLLLGNIPALGRYAPAASAGALAGAIQTQIADRLLAPGAGLALLAAYAALTALTGSALVNRRDID